MSFIDDFETIKADLAKLEQSKAKQPMNVVVQEGKPTDWTDISVYNYALQGGPHNPEDDLSCFRARCTREFEPIAMALKAYEDSQRRYLSPFYQQVLDNGSANRKD